MRGSELIVKAVLFDLGGTLIKVAAIPEIYKRILKLFNVEVTVNQILEAHRENEEEIDVVTGQIVYGKNFWLSWNKMVLEKVGIQGNIEFLAGKIDELWWNHADLQLFPDVLETLSRLKAQGIKKGIVTNGLKNDYQRISELLNFNDYFDVVVTIDTCNKGKPDRDVFLYALDKLGVEPQEALFVGDSLEYDYRGAKGAGLKPLLIDRDRKSPEKIDTIQNLTEVLTFI